MFWRRTTLGATVAAAILASCFVLVATVPAASTGSRAVRPDVSAPAITTPAITAPAVTARAARAEEMRTSGGGLAACEQRLERGSRRIPTVAIVGASYTAGVGPNNPELSWAVLLPRMLHWNAVVYGVSGAGYVRAGTGGLGPVTRMLAREKLAALAPALVIVQAGHDDAGVAARIERERVRQAIALIRAEAPRARIALITVFAARATAHSRVLNRTNNAIVAAGTAAGDHVIIMNPLAGRWTFQHARGGLHPTVAGDAWIARKVAAILRAHGVLRAPAATSVPAARSVPVICDSAFGVRTAGSA